MRVHIYIYIYIYIVRVCTFLLPPALHVSGSTVTLRVLHDICARASASIRSFSPRASDLGSAPGAPGATAGEVTCDATSNLGIVLPVRNPMATSTSSGIERTPSSRRLPASATARTASSPPRKPSLSSTAACAADVARGDCADSDGTSGEGGGGRRSGDREGCE